jgi:pyridoxamine 5'-phosphate oxidase
MCFRRIKEDAMSLYQSALDEFRKLLAEASAAGDPEPTAMTLATSDRSNRLHARVVLLKGVDTDGFRFFTNYSSAKGCELGENALVALCFHWKTLREGVQVRVEGQVERLDIETSDAYFAKRPRMSQIGAWASIQSQTLPDRAEFEARIEQYENQFKDVDVPRPPHWGGYVVRPDLIEFWYGAQYRLHERVRYELVEGDWTQRHLYP